MSYVDVDEDNGSDGDVEESYLPVIRVDQTQGRGYGEQYDDKDKADQKPWLCVESVSKDCVQQHERHVRHHRCGRDLNMP